MPRRKRIIIPGIPHHITQRGGRKQDVFFDSHDREVYLRLLHKYSMERGLEIITYCLMTNHIHLLAVPEDEESLRWTLQLTHKRYAEYINTKRNWSGHLWQERFYSCPVDDRYFWVALRYIARNPVAAQMVLHPADYPWSSAAALCGHEQSYLFPISTKWKTRLQNRKEWHTWLQESDSTEAINRLKALTVRDLPCGSDEFIIDIEQNYGVIARAAPMGRPKKSGNVVTVTE